MNAIGNQGTTAPDDLIACIEQEHRDEQNLCDMLERIADRLLEPLDTDLLNVGIATLRICIKRHAMLEEGYLYPALSGHLAPGDFEGDLVEQIRREHACDEILAHDTADQLEQALMIGRAENPEMLGYMLRGFFECRRRHIAWEAGVVLPLARRRLTRDDFGSFSLEDFEKSVAAAGHRRGAHSAVNTGASGLKN
jgi:hemerythrin-like domain-containing protein